MWLLDTSTYRLRAVQDPSSVPYAILSHVWSYKGEQTFQSVQAAHASARQTLKADIADDDPELLALLRTLLSPKITRCCDYARAHGYAFVWIDTCCIDKTNSAELSEAINSMFDWYALAAVCYVFLADVDERIRPDARGSGSFRYTQWFRRGWTLQELIAPRRNVFLSKNWRMVGTKASLAGIIEEATKIDRDVLLHVRPLHSVSVACRMSWASWRHTTRVEDEAYCLMGIFGVRLPVIYGEGRHAFVRLQEEIMTRIPDQSLFAWGLKLPPKATADPLPPLKRVPTDELRASKGAYLFASRPMDFDYAASFSPIPPEALSRTSGLLSDKPPLCVLTGYGVRVTLPVWTLSVNSEEGAFEVHLALLSCQDPEGRIPALFLSAPDSAWRRLAGSYDPAYGFSHGRDGIVKPLTSAFDMSLYDTRASCYKELTRNEWIRGARADTVRHSKQYPRIALLDGSFLDSLGSHGHLSLDEVYIPYQRMQVDSSVLLFGRAPSAVADGGFVGCDCAVVLPPWTVAHLQKLGVTTSNAAAEDGEMVRMNLWSFRSSHRLVLYHATQVITIALSACPADKWRGPLHASVSWAGPDEQSLQQAAEDAKHVQRFSNASQEDCDGPRDHVNSWTDGGNVFSSPLEGDATVTLRFSLWNVDELSGVCLDAGSYSERLYALDIHLEFPPRIVPTTSI